MVDFTIVVVCYNQEKYILEALESIKYQVQHYLGNEHIQLIIADDGSKDKTCKKINAWIKKNECFFDEVALLFSEINQGTCKNIAEAYRHINGKHFIALAGDDMLTNINVFSQMKACGDYDIIAHPVIHMKNHMILLDKNRYIWECLAAFQDEEDVRKKSKTDCPVLNGGLIGKSLITEDVLLFSEQFTLLEDQAQGVKMLEGKTKFRYEYSNTPLIIYRHSDLQVTNRQNTTYNLIKEDKEKLTSYVINNNKNIIFKWQVLCSRWHVTKPQLYRYLLRFFDFAFYSAVFKRMFFGKKGMCLVENVLYQIDESDMENYISTIMECVHNYD